MKIVRRIIAVIFALLVIILLPIAVWLNAIQSVLSAETFKNGLSSQNIYNDITMFSLPFFVQQSEMPARSVLFEIQSALPDEDWQEMTNLLLPPEWLQQQTEFFIDTIFRWMSGDIEALNTPFDVSELSARLVGEEGQQTIDIILSSAPACTEAQIAQLEALSNGESVSIPICEPPEEYLVVARDGMTDVLTRMANYLDENVLTIAELTDMGENSPQIVRGVPIIINAYNQLTLIFYLCPAALLSLIVALVVRSFKGFGRWLGPIGIATAIVIFLPILGNPASSTISEFTADITTRQQDPQTQLFQIRLVTGLVNAGFEQFNGPIANQAILILLVSIGLLAVSAFASERQLKAEISSLTFQQGVSTANVKRTDAFVITNDDEDVD